MPHLACDLVCWRRMIVYLSFRAFMAGIVACATMLKDGELQCRDCSNCVSQSDLTVTSCSYVSTGRHSSSRTSFFFTRKISHEARTTSAKLVAQPNGLRQLLPVVPHAPAANVCEWRGTHNNGPGTWHKSQGMPRSTHISFGRPFQGWRSWRAGYPCGPPCACVCR
jgi:hypothetical protein